MPRKRRTREQKVRSSHRGHAFQTSPQLEARLSTPPSNPFTELRKLASSLFKKVFQKQEKEIVVPLSQWLEVKVNERKQTLDDLYRKMIDTNDPMEFALLKKQYNELVFQDSEPVRLQQ